MPQLAANTNPSPAALLRRLPHFSLVGAVVTVASTGTNIALLKFLHTPLIPTYVIVYGASICLSYMLNSLITFQSTLSLRRLVLYFGVYLSSMGVGVLLLSIFRALLPFENWVLPLFVLPFTALWNFFFSSIFLKQGGS